jgi:hypothetical protein
MSIIMTTRSICLAVLLGLALAGAGPVGAQETPAPRAPWHQGRYWALGAQVSYPYSDFGDGHDTGYGLQAFVDYPWVPLLDLSGGVGWNRFGGRDGGETVEVWEMAAGLRFALGAFFMNGEIGWFSGVDDTTFIPGMGLRGERWEVSIRIKAAASTSWSTVRLGWYF